MSPSKLSFAASYHKLICEEIGKAIDELREKGEEVYPPYSIIYVVDGDEIPLIYTRSNPVEIPLATLDVMEHNGRRT